MNTPTREASLPPQRSKQSPFSEDSFWRRISTQLAEVQPMCKITEVLACLQSSLLPQEHSCESLPHALRRTMQASHSQAASPTAPAPGHTTRGQQRDMQCPRSFASYCATPNSSDLFNILYFYWLPIFPLIPTGSLDSKQSRRQLQQPMLLHNTEKVRDIEDEQSRSQECT